MSLESQLTKGKVAPSIISTITNELNAITSLADLNKPKANSESQDSFYKGINEMPEAAITGFKKSSTIIIKSINAILQNQKAVIETNSRNAEIIISSNSFSSFLNMASDLVIMNAGLKYLSQNTQYFINLEKQG